MPRSINGFGTSYHGGAAPIHWASPSGVRWAADHDAMECVIALGFPLYPLKALHTFHWSHRSCQTIPLRRTGPLTLRALLRPYLLAATWPAGILLFGSLALFLIGPLVAGKPADPKPGFWTFVAVDGAIFALGFLLLTGLRSLFSRSRDIRLVMGPHEWGSSDPVLWLHPPSQELAEAHDWESGRKALQEGQFSKAMFAARLLLARDDVRGEQLTDEILADPRISEVLPRLRRKPWLREELLPDDRSLRVRPSERQGYVSREGTTESIDAGIHGS